MELGIELSAFTVGGKVGARYRAQRHKLPSLIPQMETTRLWLSNDVLDVPRTFILVNFSNVQGEDANNFENQEKSKISKN